MLARQVADDIQAQKLAIEVLYLLQVLRVDAGLLDLPDSYLVFQDRHLTFDVIKTPTGLTI
jgi:hypothetical protein